MPVRAQYKGGQGIMAVTVNISPVLMCQVLLYELDFIKT